MRVLPHLNILLSPGFMDILAKFEGDVHYAKLDIPDVQDNIPHDFHRSVLQIRVKSKSIDKVTKEGVYYQ